MKTIISAVIFSLMFAGCSKKSDSDYMQAAKKSVQQNNISDAVSAYENLVKEYPESPKAPEALFQLASLYQNQMIKNIEPEKSLQKAVSLFKSIATKYPHSKEAPKALFMSGFIQANNLKSYNDATSTFNLFLKKYPDNSLSSSAHEELKNMGLSPEEILKKKKKSNM